MKLFKLLLFLLTLGTILLVLSGCGDLPPRQVVILSIETLRADRLGCHGHDGVTSPRIDSFAGDSVLFLNATAQAPNTRLSFASMMTGLFASEAYYGEWSLSRSRTTLAELCQADGLKTVGVMVNPVLYQGYGFDQGFDSYQAIFENTIEKYAGAGWIEGERLSDTVIPLLPELADQDFLLWVHYYDPHTPYVRHDDRYYDDEWDDLKAAQAKIGLRATPGQPQRIRQATAQTGNDGIAPGSDIRPDWVKAALQLYDGEIRYLDAQLGRLLDALGESGIMDQALVILTADHGESFFDHEGYRGHGKLPYQPSVHVPLMVRWPGQGPGVVSDPVALVDIMPTALQFLGIELAQPSRGAALNPAGRTSNPPILVETVGMTNRALRNGPHKLVFWGDGRTPGLSLYNVVEDPAETTDLSADEPELVRRLIKELDLLLDSLEPVPEDQEPPEVPAPIQQQIRAIGYAG